ncbi:MAG: MBOAT family O-acyltransferase [bacterium]
MVQNIVILAGSYIFYGWWDWRFLGLIVLSSSVNYAAGIGIKNEARSGRRKLLLAAGICTNLGILGVFKYYNFFVENIFRMIETFGFQADAPLFNMILPIGISFYTFQSMAYTIDVYRGDAEAELNPITFFAFISFFPQLVSGPIERANHLLPQFKRPRIVTENNVREAIWLLCWGFFLKEAISDIAAVFVDLAFTESQTSGWMTILGTLAFTLQIYCDFHAYSIIARGAALLLGFELVWNFNLPYFATSVQDFWRRWHISLSTWLRDYLYISLGGSRLGRGRTYINLMVTMLLCGLWHGAAWNFVLWGLLHGAALSIGRLSHEARLPVARVPGALRWFGTMSIVVAGWFLFRCQSWDTAINMLGSLGDMAWEQRHTSFLVNLVALWFPVAAIEIWQFRKSDQLFVLSLGRGAYSVLTACVFTFVFITFRRFEYAFIYFQF